MSVVVQKYGGTSVADATRIGNVARRIVATFEQGNSVCAVVSARGDTTDELLELAREITPDPPEREMDMLLSTGERISCALLAMAIHRLGYDAVSLTGSQVGILTDTVHTKARILDITPKRVQEALDEGKIVLVAGFQGVSTEKDITTLGRGGSDTTAVALAHALDADVCEIYTDVDGVYTANPSLVSKARKIERDLLRRDARDGRGRRAGAGRARRRVRAQVRHPPPRALELHRLRRHLGPRGR